MILPNLLQISCQSFCRASPTSFFRRAKPFGSFAGPCPAGHNHLILLVLRRTSNHSLNLSPIVGKRLN